MNIDIPSTGKPCIECGMRDGNPIHNGICNVCFSNALFGDPKDKVVASKNEITLTLKEQQHLKKWITQLYAGEMAQAQDLIDNCNITYQFAKTHSVYVKDWEQTKKQMENNLNSGILPPGVSPSLFREIINVSEGIMQKKLKKVRDAFQDKFGESIYNYLGPDGKTKKLFGIFG